MGRGVRWVGRLRGYAAVTLIVMAVRPAAGMTRAVLIDSGLQAHRVSVQSLIDGTISYFDSDRRLRAEPVGQYVQLRDMDTPRASVGARSNRVSQATDDAAQPGVIELVDGQRLVGRWIGSDPQEEKIIWRHPLLGHVAVGLDHIWAMAPSGGLTIGQIRTTSDDRVELVNGDTLVGFVTGVSAGGLEIQTSHDDQTIVLPINRVRAVIMANAPMRGEPAGSIVWLADGSRVMTRSIQIEYDQLSIDPILANPTPGGPLPMPQVNRIDLALGDGYLIDLAVLPMRVTGGGDVFGVPFAPVTDGLSVSMHAPVSVRYDLPAGAVRLAATAVLVTGAEPDPAIAWADFEVIVSVDRQVVFRARLNSDQTTAPINIPLGGRVLTIQLDSADNGPIMDRLLLRDAVVYVQPTGTDSGQ